MGAVDCRMEFPGRDGLALGGQIRGSDFTLGRARSKVSLILLSTNRAIRNGVVASPLRLRKGLFASLQHSGVRSFRMGAAR